MMVFIRLLALSVFFSANAFALDPLDLKVRTNYLPEMKTIYDATTYILEPVGYEFVITSKYAKDAYKIASQPITPMARIQRTMTIYDAIQALIGVENTIVVDHENKKISFLKGVQTNASIQAERFKNE